MQEGWKCPECGRINSPFLDHCPCKDEIKYVPCYPYYPVYPYVGTPWVLPYQPDYYKVTTYINCDSSDIRKEGIK